MAYINHLHQQHQQHQYHHASPYPPQHHQQQQHYQQHHQQHQQQFNYNMMETEEDRMEARAAEELLDADSHHEMLLHADYLPCPNTVIVGRGKKVAQHAGNVRFRELVKHELTEYSAATTKAHKSSIIVRVLTEIRNKSQHAFVKQNLTTGRWYRVEESAQRITTAQAFRDALKDNYKSSRAFKKLKREEEKKTGKEGKDSTDGDEKGTKEKKEKKKKEKKKAAAPGAAAAQAAAAKPAPNTTARSKSPPSKSTGANAVADAAKKPDGEKKPPAKSMEELRSILEQSQTALVNGNFSWWDPSAVTAMDEDKKMPPPSAIPSTSVSSCSSLLWSNHSNNLGNSKWSNHSRRHHDNHKPRSRAHDVSSNHSSTFSSSNLKWSNHSIRTLSNHSLMTISGHSTRSNSTFNGLVSKYAPSSSADMVGNPFEPTPIPGSVQEDGDVAMEDMEMDDSCFTSTEQMERENTSGQHRTYVPKSGTTFDEGIAMGLGNLSDHSLMSNMSSIHSVKGYTPEEIFADTSLHSERGGGKGSSQHQRGCPPNRYRHHMGFAMSH